MSSLPHDHSGNGPFVDLPVGFVPAVPAPPLVQGPPEGTEEDVPQGHEVPPWIISTAIHLALVFLLASVTLAPPDTETDFFSTATDTEELESFQFRETVVEAIGNESLVNIVSPSQETAAHAGFEPQQILQERIQDETIVVDKPATETIVEPSRSDMLDTVDRNGTTEHPGGVPGAIDRITLEIAASLRRSKTLVVWVFDRSPSVNARREQIAERFENVYRQLGMIEADPQKALRTGVVAFGQSVEFVTPDPVDEIGELVDSVRNIAPETSGTENVFTAVHAVATKYELYRKSGGPKREVMIVVVTDEAGDDQEGLEKTVFLTKRLGMRVYVVGNAAPFGRKTIEIPWEINGEQVTALLDTGPETIVPERLQLPFWFARESDLKEMSSGYGPWALTRLCAETGGMYLVTQDTRGPKFDAQAMRGYAPEYLPIPVYEKQVQQSLCKTALVKTALMSQVKNVPSPQLVFRAENDNVLRTEITEAQRPFAEVDYYLAEMHDVLAIGEKDREKVKEPRWQAGFDLAMGRLLAMRARAFGYNQTLADMKVSPKAFQSKDSNRWRLVPSRDINTGPAIRKLAQQAEMYLTRVVDQNPGTPWALLAERELSQPMGWDWREFREAVVTTGARNDPNDNKKKPRLLLADESKNRAPAPRPRPAAPPKVKI